MYNSNSISHQDLFTIISHSSSSSPSHQNQDFESLNQMFQNPYSNNDQPPATPKKKRNQPGNPDPDAEVIALSPKSLMATNRFVCEVCNKGFQRDQNLQLHRRGHNLPWKLKQTKSKENKKRAYVCPETLCVHHDPSRALGDLTGIKKHYCRKHGEKKLKCDKCTKLYAVKSDWKAHSKTCGKKEYKCACGSIFARKDSFVTHKAYCEAVADENGKLFSTTINFSYSSAPSSSSLLAPNPNIVSAHTTPNPQLLFNNPLPPPPPPQLLTPSLARVPQFINQHRFSNAYWDPFMSQNPNHSTNFLHAQNIVRVKHEPLRQETGFNNMMVSPSSSASPLPPLSATALLQRAMGSFSVGPSMGHVDMMKFSATWHDVSISGGTTRDFLGLAGEQGGDVGGLSAGASSSGFPVYDHDGSLFGG